MDNRETIKQFILAEVCPDLNLEKLEDDQPLISSGIVDSLGILKILSFLDDEFSVNLGSDEIKHENFSDIATICKLIEDNRQ